ncbi:MAG: hypothetical protein ACUVUF_06940 [Candidatus Bathycorpusculaceae bacterium]
MSGNVVGVCRSCGRKLTREDWEEGRLIVEEIRNFYTDELEDVEVWCSDCYDREFEEWDEEENDCL